MSDRASANRRVVGTLAVLFLITLAFWGWHAFHKSVPAPEISRDIGVDSSLAAGRAAASVRGAVVFDSYDHARENVPPRNDTRARADQWRAAPMPLEIIGAAGDKPSAGDVQLIEYLKKWEAGYREGKHILAPDQSQLAKLVEPSRLGFEALFNLGMAMGYLENQAVAAIFHRAALRRAAEDYKNLSPLHPAAPMLRAALPQMGMYWAGEYALVEQRFKLEMQLYPPLSQEGRKCMHSCAEAMYYQGNSQEAADLIAIKVQRDEQAGDLTASDKQEMGWIVGIFYRQDRQKEAIAGLAVAAQSGGSRTTNALQMMAGKISQLPPDEMEQQLAALEKYKMSAEQIQTVQARVESFASRRPPPPTTQQARLIQQRLAERRASEASARPATRSASTAEIMAARARVAASRPTQFDAAAQQRQLEYQQMMEQQRLAATSAAEQLVPELRGLLKTNPRQAVDRLLNRGGMQTLIQARRFDEVEELAIGAIIAASRDTWQVEQLQRFRVSAFNMSGKTREALSAARAEFNVAGMGSAAFDLASIAQALRAAYPADPAVANRFRLQQLAGAQNGEERRNKCLADLGGNVMATIVVDPAPFKDAIAARQSAADYDTLYCVGNLLLISGRISEAREVFEKVYKIAPPGEANYSSEAIAKVIKAEDGCIGRANEFVAAIRPRE